MREGIAFKHQCIDASSRHWSFGMNDGIVETYGGLAGVGPGAVEGDLLGNRVAGHGAAERRGGHAGDGHCD